jgi:large conductance mechanosensitive channel
MLKSFKAFIARGNVLDLSVAVIMGAAFGRIVSSLTDDIIMPVIGKVTGDLDFSSYFLRLGAIPASYTGSPDSYADLKKAGVPMLGFGEFATVAVNFLIVSFVIFLLVRSVQRMMERPADVVLLREILEELKRRPEARP